SNVSTAAISLAGVSALLNHATDSGRSSITRMRPVGLLSINVSAGSSRPMLWPVDSRMRSSSVIILRRTRLRTRANRAASSTGLVRKSSAPASRPATRSLGWSSAVTMITGTWAVFGLDLMRRQASKPSMPGIITSSRMMSGEHSSVLAMASMPLKPVTTSKYSAVSLASRSFTFDRISSTTRTRAVMGLTHEATNGFQKARYGNRLRDIGLAAALTDDFLVALHREGGDRHHGDGFQRVVFLEPLGDFQTGDFRQLDIHQDQVGVMFARDVERFHPILRLKDVVAVGIQQIVEELHVQLVVLHDQDRLHLRVHKALRGCEIRASASDAVLFASIKADVLTLP